MEITTARHRVAKFQIALKAPSFTRANEAMMTDLPMVNLMGAYLHAITEEACVKLVLDELDAGRDGSILTMNLDHLRRYTQDPLCRALYAHATLHVADGMPVIWASRVQGTPLPERVTGSNLIWSLSKAAAEHGRSIFFLGGEPGTAQSAAEILQKTYPGLKVAGTYYPDHGFERREDELTEMTQAIIAASPDIVYVALGTPKQDKLIESLRDYLPAVWWIGVGISFSFVSGTVSRAPQWMQDAGFEWLHRLLQEPRRLVKRYLIQGLPFCCRLFTTAFVNRLTGRNRQAPRISHR